MSDSEEEDIQIWLRTVHKKAVHFAPSFTALERKFEDTCDLKVITPDDIDQIIVFINQVNGKIGLNIRSLDYVNSNKVGSVTVVFEMVN